MRRAASALVRCMPRVRVVPVCAAVAVAGTACWALAEDTTELARRFAAANKGTTERLRFDEFVIALCPEYLRADAERVFGGKGTLHAAHPASRSRALFFSGAAAVSAALRELSANDGTVSLEQVAWVRGGGSLGR